MLAVIIECTKIEGQIEGVIPHLVDGGTSTLQYANDMILFMEHDLEKAKNLKLLLLTFKQLSGLKINFHTSDCFALVRPRMRLLSMPNYSDASMVNFLLGIWEYQYIIGD